MGRSQKWPDLRSPISKIQDKHFVGTDDLIIFQNFHNFSWNIVAVAQLESYFVVGSLDLTWWPDLTRHWIEIFTKVAEKMGGKVDENPAALRAAVFSLSSKNLRGGGVQTPPPPSRARVKFWKLEKILLRTVAVARACTFLEVRSRDLTWWPDLMWPRHKNLQQM